VASRGAFEPVLGVVVVFAESAESDGRVPAELGRAFPLRKGEVFFAGKTAPTEIETAVGAKTVPAAMHLWPLTEEYQHISRRHLLIEVLGPGEARVRDSSMNGSTLVRSKLYLRNGAHVVTDDETIILGADLAASPTSADLERASRYQIRLIMPAAASSGKAVSR
jgi:hypothetical protein